ncbi:MAG: hypothetical protein PGN34_22155 [Methylobacterium frigidaeris]
MRHLSRLAAGAALVASLVGATAAGAQDARVTVFPPLYRDMARTTQATRPRSELTTTPQPVHVPAERSVQASNDKVAAAR